MISPGPKPSFFKFCYGYSVQVAAAKLVTLNMEAVSSFETTKKLSTLHGVKIQKSAFTWLRTLKSSSDNDPYTVSALSRLYRKHKGVLKYDIYPCQNKNSSLATT
jgi:hypothetical protein